MDNRSIMELRKPCKTCCGIGSILRVMPEGAIQAILVPNTTLNREWPMWKVVRVDRCKDCEGGGSVREEGLKY